MAASFLQVPSTLVQLLLIIIPLLQISPTHSLVCTSQTFKDSASYANCTDLPTLKAYLHWSYDPTNSTLSVAFIAPPAKTDGWIAWAINPTGTGMAGAQALLAYRSGNGSLIVNTYNISSYSSVVQSNLSFPVLDKRAGWSNRILRIYATLALPAGMTTFNHIWQVGSTVKDGVPVKHDFNPDNLNAKGTLHLVNGESPSPSPGPGAAPGPRASPSSGANSDIASWLGLFSYGLLLLFSVTVIYGF